MWRRLVLLGVIVALVIAGAVAGYWILNSQPVTVEVAYGFDSAGRNVAVSVDGSTVGELVVPGNRSCSFASIPCFDVLEDLSLTQGIHSIRVRVNGTLALDRIFFVGGRVYAVVMVYWDGHADLYTSDMPPLWL